MGLCYFSLFTGGCYLCFVFRISFYLGSLGGDAGNNSPLHAFVPFVQYLQSTCLYLVCFWE